MAAVLVVLYIPDISKRDGEGPDGSTTKRTGSSDELERVESKDRLGVAESEQVKAENTFENTPLLDAHSPTDIEDAPITITVPKREDSIQDGDAAIKQGSKDAKKAVRIGDDDQEKSEKQESCSDVTKTNDATSSPADEKPLQLEIPSPASDSNTADVSPVPSSILRATDMDSEEFTLYQAVQVKLEELEIENDIWDQTGQINDGKDDKEFWQVTFILEKDRCDEVLKVLTELGIGRIQDTSVSMFPASYHESQKISDDDEAQKKKNEFKKSVKSKLMVAELVDRVRNNSELNFDFLMFVILASMIAAVGLAENSSVVLVASMLVSPIMGPILAGTFGFMINYPGLCRQGVKNELVSLALCIISGFVLGIAMGLANLNGAFWGSTEDWPTPEMKSRGLLRSLWVGVLIALPSGAGVALSILGGNTGSLVGVAISASLLPPAVNAGMLWAYAIISAIHPPPTYDDHVDTTMVSYAPLNQTEIEMNITTTMPPPTLYPPHCPNLRDNQYEFVYRCNMAQETAILGAVSLLLTVINIVCIFFMGVAVLMLKKVVPEIMASEKTRSFWKEDIPIARHTYRTVKQSTEAQSDASRVAREMAKFFRDQIFPDKATDGVRSSWHNVIKDLEEDKDDEDRYKEIGSNRPQLLKQFSLAGDRLLNESLTNKSREYHTVSHISQIAMTPMTSDLDSPLTTLSDSGHLKRGILRSPTGPREFLYNPHTIQRRQGRLSWAAREQHRKNNPTAPGSLKFSSAGLPRIASATSTGKQFQITPVAEEAEN